LEVNLDSSVDGLLGHDTVGGPLAPGNGDQVALRHVHHVVPHYNLIVYSINVSSWILYGLDPDSTGSENLAPDLGKIPVCENCGVTEIFVILNNI
jgi:hypothetical protein